MNNCQLTILFFLIFSTFLYGSGQQEYKGDNTYEYGLEDFNGIDGSSSFEIEVKRADRFSVLIVANRSLKDKLVVEKRGDSLYLGIKPFISLGFIIQSPKAIITMPELSSVQLSGASSMVAAGFKSDKNFTCDLSGSSSLNIDMTGRNFTFDLSGSSDVTAVIESDRLSIELSGSCDLEMYGYGNELTADLGGASSADLKDFSVKKADVELSGSSNLHINLDGILNIDASGASNLYYTGNVTLGDIELTGSSLIKEE